MKKKVCIICLIDDSLSNYKFNIKVYKENKLICEKNNNKIYFYAEYYKLYKIKISTNNNLYPKTKCQNVVFTPTNCSKIIINFSRENTNPITLKLTDQNYKGLLIEKGEITLWQNHIK